MSVVFTGSSDEIMILVKWCFFVLFGSRSDVVTINWCCMEKSYMMILQNVFFFVFLIFLGVNIHFLVISCTSLDIFSVSKYLYLIKMFVCSRMWTISWCSLMTIINAHGNLFFLYRWCMSLQPFLISCCWSFFFEESHCQELLMELSSTCTLISLVCQTLRYEQYYLVSLHF